MSADAPSARTYRHSLQSKMLKTYLYVVILYIYIHLCICMRLEFYCAILYIYKFHRWERENSLHHCISFIYHQYSFLIDERLLRSCLRYINVLQYLLQLFAVSTSIKNLFYVWICLWVSGNSVYVCALCDRVYICWNNG